MSSASRMAPSSCFLNRSKSQSSAEPCSVMLTEPMVRLEEVHAMAGRSAAFALSAVPTDTTPCDTVTSAVPEPSGMCGQLWRLKCHAALQVRPMPDSEASMVEGADSVTLSPLTESPWHSMLCRE